MGLVTLRHVESSQTKKNPCWTHVPCIGRWVLHPWTIREVLNCLVLILKNTSCLLSKKLNQFILPQRCTIKIWIAEHSWSAVERSWLYVIFWWHFIFYNPLPIWFLTTTIWYGFISAFVTNMVTLHNQWHLSIMFFKVQTFKSNKGLLKSYYCKYYSKYYTVDTVS